MATGTGLPFPKSNSVLTRETPVIDGDKYSSAAAWQKIANEGAQLANTGDALAVEVKQRQAGAIADRELADRRKLTDLRDQFQHDPTGFDGAVKGYIQRGGPW